MTDRPTPAPMDRLAWMKANQLLQRYADAVDRADVDAVLSLFAHDATWEYSPNLFLNGIAEITDYARNGIKVFTRTSHHVGPPLLTGRKKDGSFDVISYMIAEHRMTDGSRYTVRARYLDNFVNSPRGFLIKSRRVVAHLTSGTARVYNQLERNAADLAV